MSEERDGETQFRAAQAGAELRQARLVLDADQLASLVAPRARLERQLSPEAWFFSVDGVLGGAKVEGALFLGEVMLVYAPTPAVAQELANQGLRETVELLYEEYATRKTRIDDPLRAGTVQEGGGRRATQSEPGRELQSLPKLREIMAHLIGGEPWRG